MAAHKIYAHNNQLMNIKIISKTWFSRLNSSGSWSKQQFEYCDDWHVANVIIPSPTTMTPHHMSLASGCWSQPALPDLILIWSRVARTHGCLTQTSLSSFDTFDFTLKFKSNAFFSEDLRAKERETNQLYQRTVAEIFFIIEHSPLGFYY